MRGGIQAIAASRYGEILRVRRNRFVYDDHGGQEPLTYGPALPAVERRVEPHIALGLVRAVLSDHEAAGSSGRHPATELKNVWGYS